MSWGARDERAEAPKDRLTIEAVKAEFANREFCRHIALFYESIDAQLLVASAFVKRELDRARRSVYLYDENAPTQVKAALAVVGVDVERRLAAGDLKIANAETVYLDEGLHPEQMIRSLESSAKRAIAEGYAGLSVTGENTWCFHTDESFDHVIGFESDFDERAPDLPITALCQYNLDRFDQRSIAKALWTHRQIVYRGHICENPYYVPPSEYLRTADESVDARLMLEQAYTLSVAKRGVERRSQRLGVLNRVLRHNVRNEQNVVLGLLSELLEGESLNEEDRTRLETARRAAERVTRMAEKARYVDETLSTDPPERLDLMAVVDETVRETSDRFPEADITVSATGRPTVLGDANLRLAIEELLHNAIRHQEGDPPRVSVSIEDRGSRVVVDVRNPGRPIPSDDRRALETGRETTLDHASGLGLWMVKWIAENAGGTLAFPERDGECVIRIELSTVGG